MKKNAWIVATLSVLGLVPAQALAAELLQNPGQCIRASPMSAGGYIGLGLGGIAECSASTGVYICGTPAGSSLWADQLTSVSVWGYDDSTSGGVASVEGVFYWDGNGGRTGQFSVSVGSTRGSVSQYLQKLWNSNDRDDFPFVEVQLPPQKEGCSRFAGIWYQW